MSGHLHNDTSLYYITFFVERHISKTSSLLLTDTSHSPRKQYNYSLSRILPLSALYLKGSIILDDHDDNKNNNTCMYA